MDSESPDLHKNSIALILLFGSLDTRMSRLGNVGRMISGPRKGLYISQQRMEKGPSSLERVSLSLQAVE
jgi:hypothetical protein